MLMYAYTSDIRVKPILKILAMGLEYYHISSNVRVDSHRPQINAQSTALSKVNAAPQIVPRHGTRTYTQILSKDIIGLPLGLFVLYDMFPWLTAELRGCVYY